MSCPDLQHLSEFADGELDSTQAADVERHVAECANCRQLLEEVHWLRDYGRAALRAIQVKEATTPNIVRWRPLWIQWARPVSLATATAAAVVLALSIWAWFVLHPSGHNQTPTASHQIASVDETTSGARDQSSEQAEDAAFERWAAPYRKMQIPLVPMEVAANYAPTPIFPTLPDRN